MNKKQLIVAIAKTSDVNQDDCEKVINALELVLSNELSNSKNRFSAIEKICKVLNYIKDKK